MVAERHQRYSPAWPATSSAGALAFLHSLQQSSFGERQSTSERVTIDPAGLSTTRSHIKPLRLHHDISWRSESDPPDVFIHPWRHITRIRSCSCTEKAECKQKERRVRRKHMETIENAEVCQPLLWQNMKAEASRLQLAIGLHMANFISRIVFWCGYQALPQKCLNSRAKEWS